MGGLGRASPTPLRDICRKTRPCRAILPGCARGDREARGRDASTGIQGGQVAGDVLRPVARAGPAATPCSAAHLCHMFCVHHQTPAMLFSGPLGSGKTTAARLVRELVDTVGIEHSVAVLPKSADSLRGILAGSPVASFDNVRQINQGDSRRAVRGAGRTGNAHKRTKASCVPWQCPSHNGSACRQT